MRTFSYCDVTNIQYYSRYYKSQSINLLIPGIISQSVYIYFLLQKLLINFLATTSTSRGFFFPDGKANQFVLCLLQQLHGLFPVVPFVLLAHLQRCPFLLVFDVLRDRNEFQLLEHVSRQRATGPGRLTLSISGCWRRSCTISECPPLAAKCRGELSCPFSRLGLHFPFSSKSLVAPTFPYLRERPSVNTYLAQGRQSLRSREASWRWPHPPARVMNGSPVIAVQLFHGEAAVQELAEEVCVTLAGATVQREVIHPLAFPEEMRRYLSTKGWVGYLSSKCGRIPPAPLCFF